MNRPNPVENIYPLSPLQEGILFHSLLSPEAGAYMPQLCLSLEGTLNSQKFFQAWERVVARNPVLRTAFNWEKRDRPFQVVYRQVGLPWREQDWRDRSPEEQQALLASFLESDRQKGFDLKKPPLIRLCLVRLTETTYYLVWTQHHIILDGWSSGLVLKEVFSLYQGQDLPLNRPYSDYILWLKQQDRAKAREFWRDRLQGFTHPLELGGSRPARTPIFAEKALSLTLAPLQAFTKEHHLTLNTLVQGVLALLLSYYSGEEDVVFGVTSAGRPSVFSGVDSMIGLFINTLPARIQVPYALGLVPWLQRLQEDQAAVLEYEYSSLLDIQQWSDVSGGLPLFNCLLVFENYPVDTTLLRQNQAITVDQVSTFEWTSLPMTILAGAGKDLSLRVRYDSSSFSSAYINRFLGHFQTLLDQILLHPEQCLGEMTILTDAEVRQLVWAWNDTDRDYPRAHCLHEVFEQQVEKTPKAIAAIFREQELTYSQLNQRANQLAHYLQALGVEPGVSVGLCVERSFDLLVGVLGILKAGGAYVPIDVDYPLARQSFLLSDARVSFLLTQNYLGLNHSLPSIFLDRDGETIADYPCSNPRSPVTSDHEIYVIYTSGSTGRPKGVINTHRGLVNRLVWMQEAYGLGVRDRVLHKTSISFDVSVWEIFWPLSVGSCVVLAEPHSQVDTSYLATLIRQHQITTLHFVPSLLRLFLEDPKALECRSIARVICSGEVLPLELQERFFACFAAQLHNLYGPTEAAIDVTHWQCQPSSSSVPIGRAIANTQIYLLDHYARLVPEGIPGELHISGDGLARGYCQRPDLTAEKFIPNPFGRGTRLYKTGDLARYLPDGAIEFLGRLDDQVKLRGFRIELEEIATVLAEYPSVRSAIVNLQGEAEFEYLVAYVIAEQTTITPNLLRQFLIKKLPEYMIPRDFVFVERFPTTVNGKLDRRALQCGQRSSLGYLAPRNELEEKIAAIWSEVLKVEKIGVQESFFDLGGNSLLAMRVNIRLNQTFNLELPLRMLFEKTTIAALAERIEVMQTALQQFNSIEEEQGRQTGTF